MGVTPARIQSDLTALCLEWPELALWSGLELSILLPDGSSIAQPLGALTPAGVCHAEVGGVKATIGFSSTGSTVLARLEVEAVADTEIAEIWVSGSVTVMDSEPEWLLYNGFQSWDPSGYASLSSERRESWWTAGVASTSGAGLALAGVSAERSSIRFDLSPGGGLTAAYCEPFRPGEPRALWTARKGAKRAFEPFTVSAGPCVPVELALLLTKQEGIQEVPRGWLSWYHFGPWVSREHVLANASRLSAGRWSQLGHRFIQIDDGWQVAYGDWVENEKFEPGLSQLVTELTERGQSTGLWTAPFLVSAESELAKTKPDDWFVADARAGARLVDPRHVAFGPMNVLDGSNPEVQSHLEHEFSRLHGYGVTYFKIDFLYAGAYAGTSALRQGVAAIRRGVEDSYLLGCGAPLLPMVGLVDGCRVGADTATPIFDLESGIPKPTVFGDEVRAVARNLAARHYLHPWFQLDPDVALVGGNLTVEEGRQLVTVAALSGGPFFSSDDLEALPPERLALLENPEVLQLVGGQPASPDWEPNLGDLPPSVWRRDNVVAIFNWTPDERVHDLILTEDTEVRDLWARQHLGRHRGSVQLPIAGYSVRLLLLTTG